MRKNHPLDLLQLLKLLREQRRTHFTTLKVFKEAGSEYKEYEEQAGQGYEWQTRKTWIVENILRDKIGYIPKMINDKVLQTWLDRMDFDNERGPMTFRNKAINSR